MSDDHASQRTQEWDKLDESAYRYHLAQWETPKRSTLHFQQFIVEALARSARVVDMGCGAGAATAYLAAQSRDCQFVGVDLSAELVATANAVAERRGLTNIRFEADDWYKLRERREVDGVVSMQTLSWLPEFATPLQLIFERIAPRWIALSSLFYPGDISCRIEVTEHTRERCTFYNVYSLPEIGRFCAKHGYRLARNSVFEIDVDIAPPENRDLMGTYTVKVAEPVAGVTQRLQVSGPLLMNWQCIMLEKL
jgi:SAM-dependent methyltransferase